LSADDKNSLRKIIDRLSFAQVGDDASRRRPSDQPRTFPMNNRMPLKSQTAAAQSAGALLFAGIAAVTVLRALTPTGAAPPPR